MPYVNKKHFFATGAIAFISALVFLNILGWLNPIKNLTRRAVLPISESSRNFWMKLRADYDFWIRRADYISAKNELTEIKQNLDQSAAQLDIISAENKRLKSLLEFKINKKMQLFATRVVSMETSNAEKTVVISGGSNDGIKIGQAVVVRSGILIGKIVKTEPTISFVRLLVDSQSKVAVTVLNGEHSIGVAEGGYGISIKINFIPRNESIAIGDMVVTSGLESNLPKGLLIGRVVAIENESYQPFQQAIVLPEADLTKIDIIGVILADQL